MKTVIRLLLRVASLLVTAKDSYSKYLQGINLQALQKERGKPQAGQDPRTFYQQLQADAAKGPIFNEATLDFVGKIDAELEKNEVKWLAVNCQASKGKLDIRELPSMLDYLRAEKPKLEDLSYSEATKASKKWHEQFHGKEESTGAYKTKNVVLQLQGGYYWVEVPVEDLKTEGDFMGHCVGKGAKYEDKINSGKIKILSLRDSGGKPHVTIEFELKTRKMLQIQGKRNEKPVEKYHKAIESLMTKLDVKHDTGSLFYVSDEATLHKLSKDEDRTIRAGIAQNPKLTQAMMVSLAKDKEPWVRTSIADRTDLTEPLMNVLAKDREASVRESLALNPKLTESVLAVMASDESAKVRANLTADRTVPESVMTVLSRDKEPTIRGSIASLPNVSEKCMVRLAKDKNANVRRNLAKNPKATDIVLAVLAKDTNVEVRAGLATNPKLPEALMIKMVREKATVREGLASNPKLTKPLMIKLCADKEMWVRARLAVNPNLPESLVLKLYKDAELQVRTVATTNPHLPESLMDELVKSKDKTIRGHLATNPGLPESLMALLAKDKSSMVRELLETNPKLPEHIKRTLQ